MQRLTQPQRRLIERLRTAKKIAYGVRWYAVWPPKGTGNLGRREWTDFIDGRVCNALVKLGVLVPVSSANKPGDCCDYRLVEEGGVAGE